MSDVCRENATDLDSCCTAGMGEVEIVSLSALLCSVQILYQSSEIFSFPVENGQDYQSRMTLNEAQ